MECDGVSIILGDDGSFTMVLSDDAKGDVAYCVLSQDSAAEVAIGIMDAIGLRADATVN